MWIDRAGAMVGCEENRNQQALQFSLSESEVGAEHGRRAIHHPDPRHRRRRGRNLLRRQLHGDPGEITGGPGRQVLGVRGGRRAAAPGAAEVRPPGEEAK